MSDAASAAYSAESGAQAPLPEPGNADLHYLQDLEMWMKTRANGMPLNGMPLNGMSIRR